MQKHPERAAFVNAILDNPADDTVRLVFADWLEEYGEPERAEFIRCQIEAAKLPEAKRAKSKAGKRAEALHNEYGKAWRAALGLAEADSTYERGFLTDVGYSSNQFLPTVDDLLAKEPAAFTIYLEGRHEDNTLVTLKEVDEIATDSHLRAVTNITSQNDFGATRFARLMKSPHLINLRKIVIQDYMGEAGVKAIADAPAAFRLEHLDLSEALDDDDDNNAAIKLLAKSPRFASLKRLDLMFNRLTNTHVRTLLASKVLPRTLHLNIEDNEYDEERFEEELAERFTGSSDKEE